jgi:proteasome lid subunit RPN8/RPN11
MDFLSSKPAEKLNIELIHWQMMINDVNARINEEACGLVAGLNQTSTAVFPVTNVLHSRVRYRMDPVEQLEIFNEIDESNWELLAIYHSHPSGPSGPSSVDIFEATYPGAIYIIWSKENGEWVPHGYRIENDKVDQVPIHLIERD